MIQPSSKKTTLIRCCIFFALAALLFGYLNLLVVDKGTIATRGEYEAFYALDDNLSDAVFVGASNVGSFYIGGVGYNEYGVAGNNIGSSSSPLIFVPYLIEESERSQHPSVYIVDLKRITAVDKLNDQQIRLTTDMMDLLSPNRYKMIAKARESAVEVGADIDSTEIDYELPIVKYHDRVAQRKLEKRDFLLDPPFNIMLGYSSLGKAAGTDPQEKPSFTDYERKLSKNKAKELEVLLDFCDSLDTPVLFTAVPFSGTEVEYGIINSAAAECEKRGYPVLNFNNDEMVEALSLDFSEDYFNSGHVNYKGAEKYTKYLASYLRENYDLPDRRNDDRYYQWEESFNSYCGWVKKHQRKDAMR